MCIILPSLYTFAVRYIHYVIGRMKYMKQSQMYSVSTIKNYGYQPLFEFSGFNARLVRV